MIENVALLVISCDKYSDLWDDFFNLKERFWPDCRLKCYLATDSREYSREGVEVIHFGNERNWTKCVRIALQSIESPYVLTMLEDAFVFCNIDNAVVENDISFVISHKVDYLCLEIKRRFEPQKMELFAPNIRVITPHQKYGVDTAAAIWNKEYYLRKLSIVDCSAWQFEIDRCNEASSEKGITGLTLYDDRAPLNISMEEIVRLGKFNPAAVKNYKKIGYIIDTKERGTLSWLVVFKERFIMSFSNECLTKRFLKKIAQLFGYKFFTE